MRFLALSALALLGVEALATPWFGFGGDAQHTSLASTVGQPLEKIWWSAKVDLNPQYSGDHLLAHYGTPCITPSNTVIVPVKTGADDGFRLVARNGSDGSVRWRAATDYSVPPHRWFPSYGPTLMPATTTGGPMRVAYAMSGGRVNVRSNADAPTADIRTLVFYGRSNYLANPTAYDTNVKVCTPLTVGPDGSLYFGFVVLGDTPLNMRSGIAKIKPGGSGLRVAAAKAAGDDALTDVKQNSAPALSREGTLLYVVVNAGSFGRGKLLALDTATLKTVHSTDLNDPSTGNPAAIDNDGTASPMVAPDHNVYVGVLERPFPSNHARGWLLRFNRELTKSKTPGAFGWDITPSVVPASAVPFYTGDSKYLIFTKYNNYAGAGGDGVNRMAILDPNAVQTDPVSGIQTMKEVAAHASPTPDPHYVEQGFPDAVMEWCVNHAVVDPFGKAVYMNNEDGVLYRWDLTTNTLSQSIRLTPGLGEAYTPTAIGPDGRIYAINNATLFSVGAK